MKLFSTKDSQRKAFFLIKQQCVYLEKSIIDKHRNGIECYLAFIWKDEWSTQINSFNAKINCDIDAIRFKLEQSFLENGCLEVRFQDINLLSLLFSDCTEAEVSAFCSKLKDDYRVNYCGRVSMNIVGIDVFDGIFSIEKDDSTATEERCLSVGLSYQQNYLVDVVSRDRNEEKEKLFIEAVDQALLAHHVLIDGNDI